MPAPLVLVDGSSYLYRAFHALPPLTTSTGQPVGAIRGVISMLNKLADSTGAERMVVVFDASGKTFRDDMYAEYKANREKMPDELREQIEPLHSIIRALGFPLLAVPGVEADDVIGTLAKQAEAAGEEVLISTGDKDLAQLVTDQVTLVNTMSDSTLTPIGVEEKFGVPPERMIDFLALTGDSVDNVPGIPKCGPKTAAKWLNAYGSLDGVVESAESIGGKIGETFREHMHVLPLSKALVTIKTDCELPVGLEQLARSAPDLEQLTALYTDLELNQFLKRIQQSPVVNETSLTTPEAIETSYELVTTPERLTFWMDQCRQAKIFALDTETTSLVARHAKLVGVSLSCMAGQACYIPVGHVEGKQLDMTSVLFALSDLFADRDLTMVGHNLKYDLTILETVGLLPQCRLADTMLMSYVLDAAAGRHDMDSLAKRLLGVETTSYEDVCGKGAKQIRFDEVALESASHYASEDADITLRLYNQFVERLNQVPSLQSIYQELELPVMQILREMENHGALLDVDILNAQSVTLGVRLEQLESEAQALAGRPFNLASPKQLQEILFDELQLPVLKKTPKGAPSTNEEVLQELALDYPLPKLLIEHRSLSKLKGTYTDRLPGDCDPADGRVHTSFHQAVTSTGRLSSSDPNLQNIPIRTEEGRRIRKAFIAPDGWSVMAADYSQIELRIMAHLSGDKSLVDAFARGDDIHRATAAEVFDLEPMFVTDEQRRRAKAINFGLIYGMSAFGLARQLGIERAEAAAYIDRYFERYPGVRHYMDSTRAMAHEKGYVETVYGRRLTLPDIHARQAPVRQAAERAAINAPMQGTAADIIKRAMLRVHQALATSNLGCHLLLQVHDELVFEVRDRDLDPARQLIRLEMEAAAELSVPLVVDIGSGESWFEAH
ncbi:MAG: DNA polymerase I [Litoricola sp.]|jgi:DNA polymerase-1|nr:DNA polymerase I [Litorivicinus sp.]MBL6809325.1 DNA polymerase I [Litorivicinus sp.]MBL6824722.1 DNA polymerase I [Litorivicinus sp.]